MAKNRGSTGSITIEACISLPVFLSFFYLLLFLIRVACINLVMDHAVSETARYFAESAYPLSILNEYEDEKVESQKSLSLKDDEPLIDTEGNILPKRFLTILLDPGEMKADNIDLITGMLKSNLSDGLTEVFGLGILDSLHSEYQAIKDTGKYYLAKRVLTRHLQESWVNQDQVYLSFVKLPEGQAEYAAYIKDGSNQLMYLQPERDFNRDDVVIMAEYIIKIPFPFLSGKNLRLRYAAVERAWLKGSNGVYTSSEEGLDLFNKNNDKGYVYITRTGSKYHLYSTCAYLEKSSIPITREEAEKRGLTPHLGCPNRFK